MFRTPENHVIGFQDLSKICGHSLSWVLKVRTRKRLKQPAPCFGNRIFSYTPRHAPPLPPLYFTQRHNPKDQFETSMSNSQSSFSVSRSKSTASLKLAGHHDRPRYSGTFTDFQILSSANQGWNYNVMKFAVPRERDEIEPEKWNPPVKLNRKDYPPPESSANPKVSGSDPDKTLPTEMMRGRDGRPVIGFDGRFVMVGSDGKVVAPAGPSKDATTDNASNPNKRAKRKMREVQVIPEETRNLLVEEAYPWVIEEAPQESKPGVVDDLVGTSTSSTTPAQVWSGYLLDPERNQTHALFSMAGPTIRFIRSNRFYKFNKPVMNAKERQAKAEAEQARIQLSRDSGDAWVNSRLRSEIKDHEDGEPEEEDDNEELFRDDDDEEGRISRKRKNRVIEEDAVEEAEYEEEFADDDDETRMDGNEEDVRESERRLKKQYRKGKESEGDNEDDDMEEVELTKAGRAIRRLVKRREEDVYDSDEEDPYNSEEEEDDYNVLLLNEPAVMDQESESERFIPLISHNTSVLPSDPIQPQTDVASSNVEGHAGLKRKAADENVGPLGSVDPSPTTNIDADGSSRKKQKRSTLTEDMVITYLREKEPGVVSQSDVIKEFRSYLNDEKARVDFRAIIKKIALIDKDKNLTLKNY